MCYQTCTPSAVWLSNHQTPRWRCRWSRGQYRCTRDETMSRLLLRAAHALCLQLSRLRARAPLPPSPVARGRVARQALEKGPPLAESPNPIGGYLRETYERMSKHSLFTLRLYTSQSTEASRCGQSQRAVLCRWRPLTCSRLNVALAPLCLADLALPAQRSSPPRSRMGWR